MLDPMNSTVSGASKALAALLLTGVLLLPSCDFLDYNEEDFLSDREEVFQDFFRTEGWLTNIYADLPGGFNSIGGAMRASATDNAVEANTQSGVYTFVDGSWGPANTPDDAWNRLYRGIRYANIFIEELDTTIVEDTRYNDDYDIEKDQIQYFRPEARFLRAYFYFELMKRYGGGVPLITEELTPEEANAAEPASLEEIVSFIVEETEAVAPDLPVTYSNVEGQQTGRATRGAARALKARTLLYAASPLFDDDSGDAATWDAVAEASAEIINARTYALDSDYENAFNNFSSSGLILGRRFAPSNSFEQANFPPSYGGAPGTCPTQNLVSTYDMQSTGKDIDAPESEYDPEQPYTERDPRLRQTVIVNNSTWKGRPVQSWRGGDDGPPQELACPTGYYLKKYVIEDITVQGANQTSQQHLWVLFRYGEVLLNYAEAMNEAYGPTADPEGYGLTAYEAVNEVRNRAGMFNLLQGPSQSELRQKVREERRVELAFENHRFWDLRRWEIGPETTTIREMQIERQGGSTFAYDKAVLDERVWEPAFYRYPIPQSELLINDNLTQTPNW
jgi:hypothetical protein